MTKRDIQKMVAEIILSLDEGQIDRARHIALDTVKAVNTEIAAEDKHHMEFLRGIEAGIGSCHERLQVLPAGPQTVTHVRTQPVRSEPPRLLLDLPAGAAVTIRMGAD